MWFVKSPRKYIELTHRAVLQLRIRVPDTVSANYTVDVFFVPNNDGRPLGVVLSAIQNIDIDADTSPHFTLTLEVLTSSAHPYELDYTAGNSGADLGDITDGGSTTCSGTDVCVQTHTITMPITKYVFLRSHIHMLSALTSACDLIVIPLPLRAGPALRVRMPLPTPSASTSRWAVSLTSPVLVRHPHRPSCCWSSPWCHPNTVPLPPAPR